MPKRGAIALLLTGVGLVLLLSFKTPDAPVLPADRRAAVVPSLPPGSVGDQPASATPTAPGQRAPAQTAAPEQTPKPTGSGTIDGPVVSTRFGDVQVEVKLSGGRIADIVALVLPNDRERSALISQYAEPMLRSEALQAQSAQIDIVSGATYTSEGYAQSLQGALDQRG